MVTHITIVTHITFIEEERELCFQIGKLEENNVSNLKDLQLAIKYTDYPIYVYPYKKILTSRIIITDLGVA